MSEPWFDPNTFGALAGAILGGGGGTTIGILGGLTGYLAPKGRGRTGLTAAFGFMLCVGLASLAMGVAALVDHQPYVIWYPLLLCGVLFTAVLNCMMLFVTLPRAYLMAEGRKLAAGELRSGL